MAKLKNNEQNNLFIFNALPANSPLKRDEPNMVVHLFCLAIFLIAVIDLVVIIFFIRTNARIDAIRHDNFTEVIISNLEEAEKKNEGFADKAKEIIRNKNAYIKEFVDHMEYDSRELEKLQVNKIELKTLDKLKEALLSMEEDKNLDLDKLKDASRFYNEAELEIKALNNYLMPIDEFNTYQERIEKSLKTILEEIKGNLDNFLNQLNYLALNQSENQKLLLAEMTETIAKFEDIYSFVYKNDRYTKLNNFYDVEFIEFDREYVPFSNEFENMHFGAQLTKESTFNLRMPRMYYCTLQAMMFSDNTFNVRFEYVKKSNDEKGKETIVFDTERLQGGYQKPVSFGEIKVFNLDQGLHTLYLRVISEGTASQLHMKKLKMSCLSYRNFIENAAEGEDDDL